MSIVSLHGVHKAYGHHTVLRAADLTVSRGERVGVVGLNGAGKSTLARILAGLEPPDTGTVQVRRGARILYLEQKPEFTGDPTAEQAVLEGLRDWTEASERHAALSRRLADEC